MPSASVSVASAGRPLIVALRVSEPSVSVSAALMSSGYSTTSGPVPGWFGVVSTCMLTSLKLKSPPRNRSSQFWLPGLPVSWV